MDTTQEPRTESETGLPIFETLVILNVIRGNPDTLKGEVVLLSRLQTGADEMERGRYLKFVDNMLRVGLLCRHDFKYRLTPAGERHLAEITNKIMPGLRALVYQ